MLRPLGRPAASSPEAVFGFYAREHADINKRPHLILTLDGPAAENPEAPDAPAQPVEPTTAEEDLFEAPPYYIPNPEGIDPVHNEFRVFGIPEKLAVEYRCRMPEGGEWTGWKFTVNFGGPVEPHHLLFTGSPIDGVNLGYVVFKMKSSHCFQFRVFGVAYPGNRAPYATNHLDGYLGLHEKPVVPESLEFVRTSPGMVEVQWENTGGEICRARLWGHKPGDPPSTEQENLGCRRAP